MGSKMSENVSHFCFFVRRQDYVRAAYWFAKCEKELPARFYSAFNAEIIHATYKTPDYKLLCALLEDLANDA